MLLLLALRAPAAQDEPAPAGESTVVTRITRAAPPSAPFDAAAEPQQSPAAEAANPRTARERRVVAQVSDRGEAARRAPVDRARPEPATREEAPPPVVELLPVVAERLPSVFQPDLGAPAPAVAEFLAQFNNSTERQTLLRETAAPNPSPGESPGAQSAESTPSAGADGATERTVEGPTEGAAEPSRSAQWREGVEAGRVDGDDRPERDRSDAVAGSVAREEQLAGGGELRAAGPPTRNGSAPSGPAGTGLAAFAVAGAIARASRSRSEGGRGPIRGGPVPGLDAESYVGSFGAADAVAAAQIAQHERESGLIGDHTARWDRLRESLDSYDIEVEAGAETSLNTAADAIAPYIHYLHNKMHARWRGYLNSLNLTFRSTDPLGDMTLFTTLEIVIAADGGVRRVRIRQGSGVLAFDARAVELMHEIAPHRPPPAQLLSTAGEAVIRWSFHRDNRACGTFSASGHRVSLDGG